MSVESPIEPAHVGVASGKIMTDTDVRPLRRCRHAEPLICISRIGR